MTTEYTGQPFALECSKYTCIDDGVFVIGKDGNLINIFPQPIMPTELIYNITSKNERIKIDFFRGEWKSVIVDKCIIANKSKILELSNKGICVTSSNNDFLVDILSKLELLNYSKLPKTKEVSHLGWCGVHGFIPYNNSIKLAELDGINSDSYTSKGDYNEWLNATNIARRSHLYMRILLASSFASPLLSILNSLPFMTHIWGTTGMGKSVGLMCAAAIWGNPDLSDGIIANFNTTKVGIERLCEFVNNVPLFIDELEAGGNKDPQELVYMVTQGKGRTRGNKNGGMDKTATWRCTSISTGEHPLTNSRAKGGTMNRIIDLKASFDLLKNFTDVVEVCNSWRNNYGFAGKIYTDYIKSLDKNYIYNLYKSYLAELNKYDGTGKQNMSGAVLLTADKLANDCIFNDNLNLNVSDFKDIILSNNEVSQAERLFNQVMDWVSINERHFNEANDNVDQWGRIDRDEKTKNISRIRIINTQLEQNFFKDISPAPILSDWKRAGYIEAPEKGNTKDMWVKGVKVSVVILIPKKDTIKLDNLPEVDEELPY